MVTLEQIRKAVERIREAVATLERIRHEKNRDAGRFRLAFFARGNQPLSNYILCH